MNWGRLTIRCTCMAFLCKVLCIVVGCQTTGRIMQPQAKMLANDVHLSKTSEESEKSRPDGNGKSPIVQVSEVKTDVSIGQENEERSSRWGHFFTRLSRPKRIPLPQSEEPSETDEANDFSAEHDMSGF